MRKVVLACAAALLLSACDKPVVVWGDPTPIDEPSAASILTFVAGGKPALVPAKATPPGPSKPGVCAATVVTAAGKTRLHAAWWSVRPDSSAVLYAGSSPDSGKTWDSTVPVDTTDISSTGCNRPLPSLAVVGDDEYLAYSMKAPEGTGVFFAHTMASMLHSPVPVIYGERLVATAIAADSQRVAVAYEEPNGRREQVDVALSFSQGHLFEQHVSASRSIDVAVRPMVAFTGDQLAVSWITRRPLETATSRVVRVGRLQPWN
jgi:hypothetical protein